MTQYAVWSMIIACILNGLAFLFLMESPFEKTRRAMGCVLLCSTCLFVIGMMLFMSQPAMAGSSPEYYIGLIANGVLGSVLASLVWALIFGPAE